MERIEEGLLDKDEVILAFCCYLSEHDVYDMMSKNQLLDFEEEENESICQYFYIEEEEE